MSYLSPLSIAKRRGESIGMPCLLVIAVRDQEAVMHLEISLLLYASGSILVRRSCHCQLLVGQWRGWSGPF